MHLPAREICKHKASPRNSVPHGRADQDETPPQALDAAIIFAPIGDLVPKALRAVRKRWLCCLRRYSYERHSKHAICDNLG